MRKQLMMLRLQSSQMSRSIAASRTTRTRTSKERTFSTRVKSVMSSSLSQKSVMGSTLSRISAGPDSQFLPNPPSPTPNMQKLDGDLSILHQNLKIRLSELEHDVLQTIDSWATSLAKAPFVPDVLEVAKERDAIPQSGCEKDPHDKILAASLQISNGDRRDIVLETPSVNECKGRLLTL
mmetsp:Transcript_11234/g.18650  ORF Transcript_11234/g.18650 Transcript_11234/m.18650 type:complete len:180 (-) Transcript_11234:236-775(-)